MATKAPYWLVDKVNMTMRMVVNDKPFKTLALPGVCAMYTGATRDYVVHNEVEKLKEAHKTEFTKQTYAWMVVQELTGEDKEYLRYHKLWLESCDKHGERDAASRALARELDRRAERLTPAGNHAVDWFNRARAAKVSV
jgi:hypothetical protein